LRSNIVGRKVRIFQPCYGQSVPTVTVLGWLHEDGITGRFVDHKLSQDFCVSLFRVLQRFQNQDVRALGRSESIAPGSKRLAR
jgi:hypothetical protein